MLFLPHIQHNPEQIQDGWQHHETCSVLVLCKPACADDQALSPALAGIKQRQVRTEVGPSASLQRIIEPSQAFVARATRQAAAARLRIGLALPQPRQGSSIHVEALHHFVHPARLPFHTASHWRLHGDSSLAFLERYRRARHSTVSESIAAAFRQ
jgi:hypothetical protein